MLNTTKDGWMFFFTLESLEAAVSKFYQQRFKLCQMNNSHPDGFRENNSPKSIKILENATG